MAGLGPGVGWWGPALLGSSEDVRSEGCPQPFGVHINGKKESSAGLCWGPTVSRETRVRPEKAVKGLRTLRSTAPSPGGRGHPPADWGQPSAIQLDEPGGHHALLCPQLQSPCYQLYPHCKLSARPRPCFPRVLSPGRERKEKGRQPPEWTTWLQTLPVPHSFW